MTANARAGIYKISNLVTNKVYIGSSVDMTKRMKQHFTKLRNGAHSSIKLQNSFNKYGEASFKFEPLLMCANYDLLLYEQRAIDVFNAVEDGYNIAPKAGNSLGIRRTVATKLKVSSSIKRQWEDPVYRAKVDNGHARYWTEEKRKAQAARVTGIKHSEAHKAAISKSGKERFEDVDQHTRQKRILDCARASPIRKARVAATLKTQEYREKQSAIITAWWVKRKAIEMEEGKE